MAEPTLFAGLNPQPPVLSQEQQGLINVREQLANAPELSTVSPDGQIVLGQPQNLDIYTLYTGEGVSHPYTIPEIAFAAVVQQKLSNPSTAYAKLKETMTDEEIIQRLALDPKTNDLYSLPTEKEAFAKGLTSTALSSSAAILGGLATAAVTTNPYAVGVGGVAAGLTALMAQEAAGDGTRIFPSRRNPEMAGEFMGGAPFMALPFVTSPGAMTKAGENLLFEGIKKLPYAGPVMRFVTEGGGKLLESGFDISRRNPVLATLVESSATTAGSGAGYMYGRSMDPTAVDPTMGRLGTEVVASVLNPVSILQLVPSGINMWRRSLLGKGREGQEQLVADEFIRLFDELEAEGAAPQDIAQILQRALGEDSALQKFLISRGADPGNPTSAQKTGHPIIAIMQANAIKNDPSGFGRRVQNSALKNLNQLEVLMGGLLQLNTPEALGLYAQVRGQYFDRAMEGFVSNALLRYRGAVNRATRAGEAIDEEAELNKLLSAVVQSAREQEKAFYGRIPTNYETKATNLIETFGKLQLDNAILTQPGRFDTGKNFQSIAVAVDDIKEILKKNSTDPDDIKEFAQPSIEEVKDEVRDAGLGGLLEGPLMQAADAPEDAAQTAVAGGRRLPLPEKITSGDLINLRSQILEAIADQKPGPMGETRLAESLGLLEEAIRKDLSELPSDREGAIKRNIENAVAFSESLNDTFGQLFTSVRRSGPPELFMERILRSKPSAANVALRDIDNAVTFLERELMTGEVGTENLRNVYAEAQQETIPGFEPEFFIPKEGAARGEYELYEDLNKLPYRQRSLRQLEERVLRSIFKKYERPDGTPDQLGIDRWLADDNNIALIERISPPVETTDPATGQTVRQSPLLEDLKDMQTRGSLYLNTRDAANRRTQLAHEQIPLFAFMTGGIPMRDNPPLGISRLLGEPNNRPDNPITNYRAIAKNIMRVTDDDIDALGLSKKYTPDDLRKSLFNATVGQAFVYGRGDAPGEPFSFIRFNDFMNKPIIPGEIDELGQMSASGRRAPSPLEILKEEGVIDEKAFRNFQTVVDEAMNIENALLQIKTLESDDRFQVLADLYARNPVTTELVTRILGARFGVEMAGLLPGGMGQSSLIAASAGSRALQALFNKVPRTQFKDVYMEALTNPEYMSKLIGIGLERKSKGARGPTVFEYMNDLPLATKAVTAARSLLVGAGVREDALPTTSEIMAEIQEEPDAEGMTRGLYNPLRAPTPGEEAGVRRRRLRQQAPPPQAMTDQARQFMPQMPMPQVAPPVAQAPANPNTRAQFAAMYPNDITSDIIRTQQGIGSLLGNV